MSTKDIFLTKDDKVDLIKWMISLIVGLFIALVGSMAAFIEAYGTLNFLATVGNDLH